MHVTLVADIESIKSADIDYSIAQKFYEARDLKEVFSNPRLASVFKAAADNYRMNLAARGVDGVMDKLVLRTWRVTREGERDIALEESFKALVWDRNNLKQTIPDSLQAAEVQGDSYLLVWPDEDESSDAVDVFLHKAFGARMFYDDENERVKRAYVRTWLVRGAQSTSDDATWLRRVNELTYFEIDGVGYVRVRKLISRGPAASAKADADYEPFTDEDVVDLGQGEDTLPPGESITPMDQLPVFHLRTARPYGVPDHECLYGCQNLLIKTVVTLGESVDGFGLPWRWRTRSASAQLGAGGDAFESDDEDDEDDEERVRTRAGEVTDFYDTDAVGQLEPSDVSNLLDPIRAVFQLASELSSVPMDLFQEAGADASGVAKREHRAAYHAKINKRRTDYGDELARACEFALSLAVGDELDDVDVVLVWSPMNELTDLERYAQMTAGQGAGLPFRQVAIEAGYDPEEVQGWIDDGLHPDNSLSARAERLKLVATAVRELAAATELGGLDATAIMGLIESATKDVDA